MSTAFDCPRCGTLLSMSERAGIEIDYCPKCRGVWLDRGELDKIIERAASDPAPPASGIDPSAQPVPSSPAWGSSHGRSHHGGGHHGGHRRKSWLREIFD